MMTANELADALTTKQMHCRDANDTVGLYVRASLADAAATELGRQQTRIEELEADLERWRLLHNADDPEDSIVQDAPSKIRRVLRARLNVIREQEVLIEMMACEKQSGTLPPETRVK